ncbi:hypothetical protein LTR35_011276 [Friedmanniomyces endolithicus]|uniref:alpha-1,2-Mannosidase n=1 Tax=Friedmanniomyces endolithicus TaxID=329885 RepID=A0AAN6FKL9_9PEZI|nr:hypothetical protein LTR35_011276 [Friedmanniomyces endolithicus]KAK0292176.1 hypothetical protein LTS00_008011 [Friedmanniomyces endolithicus]KAK0320170.1 hypothetical protein LTR82_008687 [Friedmanniomyces endolithicus]KAK0986273.1 hypothetical protein LTR54_013444 [Friedmanniomyces endolithicus]
MAFSILSLSLAATLVTAESSITSPPASWSESVGGWWPNPASVTESSGPIIPSYTTPAVTTSLSSVPAYTYTSSLGSSSTAAAATVAPFPNATTSAGSPSSTGHVALPTCKPIQYAFPAGEGGNAERAAAIKEAYLYGWEAYVKFAFGKDELQPLNGSGVNDWYGWGVTIVDAIDTAIIMNLTDVVAQQLAFIQKIDFTTTTYGPVEIFDVSIRYLGGLISAYDLLKSGQFFNAYPQNQIEALLSQAVSLADKIAFGFNTPTGLSSANVNFTSNQPVFATYTIAATNVTYNSTNTASTGTYILDWSRLSDLTGNQTYRQLAERAENYLINPSPAPVYPGLVGTQFDIDTGRMLTFDGGFEAGVDSFLEYLLKSYQYQATATTTQYKDFWLQAAQSAREYIALHPYGFPDLTFLSQLDVNGTIALTQDDFTCFAGGNFLLGAKLLDMPDLLDLGLAVTDGCHQTYNTTLTGLGPIQWRWYNASNLAYDPRDDIDAPERKLAAKYGYFIPNGEEGWASRPEPTESLFYAYRITGDSRWAEYAWQNFLAINETARNANGFATVNNVNEPFGGSMTNALDSFFFAEVMKYLYLIFSDPSLIHLAEWVFNTEAHPYPVQCGGDNGSSVSGTSNGTTSSLTGYA